MIGAARATSAWRATDLWGDQDSIMVGFRYPDGSEHCALVLVDHLLGGIAKDATVLWTPIAEVLQGWEGPEFHLVEEGLPEPAGRFMSPVTLTYHSFRPPIPHASPDTAALFTP